MGQPAAARPCLCARGEHVGDGGVLVELDAHAPRGGGCADGACATVHGEKKRRQGNKKNIGMGRGVRMD